jgi:short-chain fatty acids transporter
MSRAPHTNNDASLPCSRLRSGAVIEPTAPPSSSWLVRFGLRLSEWFEAWLPDPFPLAIIAIAIVYVASVAVGASPVDTAYWFGAGFWDLVVFTMQMTLIIVSGYTVATAPPVYAVIRRMAVVPKTARGAVAFVALFSMLSSLV